MSARRKSCHRLAFVFAVTFLFWVTPVYGQDNTEEKIKDLPECSLSKTNESCKFLIDRRKPVAPPTLQMYSNQRVTVIVKNPLPFERYFLDYTTGQATVSPDVTSSIIQGLFPSLAKLGFALQTHVEPNLIPEGDPCKDPAITSADLPPKGGVKDVVSKFQNCAAKLAGDAIKVYQMLEPFVAPDSVTPSGIPKPGDPQDIKQPISDFLTSEVVLSGKITAISTSADPKYGVDDAAAITQLSNLQKFMDAVAADLLGYSQRISDVQNYQNGSQDCENYITLSSDRGQTHKHNKNRNQAENNPKPQCISITSKRDDERIYQNMVTRTITYSLNSLNLISNLQEAVPDPSKKKLLATVIVNFADTETRAIGVPHTSFRWEASAGVFFSSLPIRSFSVAPVFTNKVVSDNLVAQNIVRPTVVPFAAANYRLTNDLGWTRWKSDLYWTVAVGINPNTVSTDFATGPSISYRALMFSALCHVGHDVSLTQGFQNNQSLGAAFTGTLPTQNYWTPAFAFGVSVRVPSLTGR